MIISIYFSSGIYYSLHFSIVISSCFGAIFDVMIRDCLCYTLFLSFSGDKRNKWKKINKNKQKNLWVEDRFSLFSSSMIFQKLYFPPRNTSSKSDINAVDMYFFFNFILTSWCRLSYFIFVLFASFQVQSRSLYIICPEWINRGRKYWQVKTNIRIVFVFFKILV